MGNLKAIVLLAGLTIVLLVLGALIANDVGVVCVVFICVITNVRAYWYANIVILTLYQARPITENDSSSVLAITKSLTDTAGLPAPAVYVITNDIPTALIVGRKPSLAVTTGLLTLLDKNELTAVIAREIACIPHGDAMLYGVSAMVSYSLTALADVSMWASLFGNNTKASKLNGTVMCVVSPIASMLIKLVSSHTREFELDAAAAKLCGQPLWLATALEKLDASQQKEAVFSNVETHPSTAQLFIVNPLQNTKLSAQFATQPVTAERILRLQAMATR